MTDKFMGKKRSPIWLSEEDDLDRRQMKNIRDFWFWLTGSHDPDIRGPSEGDDR